MAEDQTITDSANDQATGDTNNSDATSQPDTGGQQSAEDNNKDSQSSTSDGGSEDTGNDAAQADAGSDEQPQDESEIKKFAEAKGFDPEKLTEGEVKALTMARESEQRMHEATTKKATETKEAIVEQGDEEAEEAGADETQTQAQRELNKLRVTNFFSEYPEAVEHDEAIAKVIQERPYLANDLEAAYALAKSQSTEAEKLNARNEGKQEARTEAAQAARSANPGMSATTSAPEKKKEDDIMAGLTAED